MAVPRPEFRSFRVEDLRQVLARYPWRRQIRSVHLHHTWRPDHSQYRGEESIVSMWSYHTQDLGWSDIAQHLTVAPDGTLWTGRDWNRRPASASGFNGNALQGPFMIEMVGNFDAGRDRLDHQQRRAVVETIALLHEHFLLQDDTLTFHSSLSGKTCPGTGVDRDRLLAEIAQARVQAADRAATSFGAPFDDDVQAVQRIVDALTSRAIARGGREDEDGELPESGAEGWARAGGASAGARGGWRPTPDVLSELAPHVISLTQGRLSSTGDARTTPGDVRSIFEEHLPKAVKAADDAGRPLRLVFYAHGGLVGENAGLGIAWKHLEWWRKNGVYPVNFIWETGFWETLFARLPGRRAAARDLFPDWLVERLVRGPGGNLWARMKHSAASAVEAGGAGADPRSYGGARFVAEQLSAFLAKSGNAKVEIHAIGHSAGAIFHSHFLPVLREKQVPVSSLHLLAPAITVADFRRRLEDMVGSGLDALAVFTMRRALERADEVAEVYDKSLLYLIHHALEPQRDEPILGLEESLRGDDALRRLFALDGSQPDAAEVVWSKTAVATGRSASTATTHGGFDDDAPTMDSVLRRILDVGNDAPIVSSAPFLEAWRQQIRGRGVAEEDEERAELAAALQCFAASSAAGAAPAAGVLPPWAGPVTEIEQELPVAPAPWPGPGGGAGGRRRALCVGIDRYSVDPLSGCVADARLWARTLVALGFEPPAQLTDDQATRSSILGALERLVAESRSGDVLVFQYAGHGISLPDLNGDESDDRRDEALCPIDCDEGRYVIDDDLAAVLASLPAGVNLTLFMDCCYSGTISRLAAGGSRGGPNSGERARFLVPTSQDERRHAEFRRQIGTVSPGRRRGPTSMREVTFSACQPFQLSYESDGQGHFTLRATRLLAATALRATHAEFERQVREALADPRQEPLLDCAPVARDRLLLAPLTGSAASGRGGGVLAGGNAGVARLLRAVADTMG